MKSVFKIQLWSLLILVVCTFLITGCQPQSEAFQTPSAQVIPTQTSTSPTKTIISPSNEQTSEIHGILLQLENLSLSEFYEQSFFELSLRYPESLAELGIETQMGIHEAKLNDLSQKYLEQTLELEKGILAILQSFDRATLSPEEKTTFDIYEWYLQDFVAGQELNKFQYIASYFILNSEHNQTFTFFTETHPLNTFEQAQDYVKRLWHVGEKFDQIVEGLRIREEAGIIQPKFSLQWALYNIKSQMGYTAKLSPYYTRLEEALNLLSISEDERTSLLNEAERAIEDSVMPAYTALIAELEHHESIAPAQIGLWQYEGGQEYYEYLLEHYTTTNLTSEEIHQLGIQELSRIHSEMRLEFEKLGYPQDEDLYTLFQRVSADGGIIPASQAVKFYEDLIAQAYIDLEPAFDDIPEAKVIVVGGQTGGYYIQGSLDGSRPGAFYAAVQGSGLPYYQMPSLTYHEAIPGHHFQIALAQEMALPTFRNHVSFTAYVEGWALYAERLAYDLGWYQDDPYANLGRLQYEALRAARLVLDTGIHAKQWSYQEAIDFCVENVGWTNQNCEFEVARYAVLPGQATAYMIGMLKILELRERAQITLEERFELSEFHHQILSGGSMPLNLLEVNFQQTVLDAKN
jgi:uncharacterized protein (DUF885 family)